MIESLCSSTASDLEPNGFCTDDDAVLAEIRELDDALDTLTPTGRRRPGCAGFTDVEECEEWVARTVAARLAERVTREKLTALAAAR